MTINHQLTHLTTACLFLALSVSVATAARPTARPWLPRKAPETITGTVDRFADADTYWLKRSDGTEVKVREWVADAPETAHANGQVDQPGGAEALRYATEHWQGKTVTVTVKGRSYDRIVGETVAKGETRAIGLDLVSVGHAQVYPLSRPRPPKAYEQAQAAAMEKRVGIWATKQSEVVAPWTWRQQQREKKQ